MSSRTEKQLDAIENRLFKLEDQFTEFQVELKRKADKDDLSLLGKH